MKTYERYKFNTRVQESGESIDTYLSSLGTLAKMCNYEALEDSFIRDRVVIGIRDESTRKKLLQQSKLTLRYVLTFVAQVNRLSRELYL